MAAIPMLRRNVKLEISAPAICAALARQLHIPNNFTFGQPKKALGHEPQIDPWLTPYNRSACQFRKPIGVVATN
jgi:hypothetical protein